ncbi:hypothetical protein SDC9_105928 [bioreactor metagenome]|uniref:NAD-specific glutamate dehydrogenase n=1 Tax=bioreactor metagenome TaxID=1076179 RepID=A0A645B0W9_9ZZZZ
MLADDDAAAADQGIGGLALSGDIKPGVGVGHVHMCGGNDGADAQEERGVAGNHFRIGIGAHIADVGIGDGAGIHQLLQLHAGHDTGDIAGLIDIVEEVAEIGESRGLGMSTGCVGKVNVGILLSGLHNIGLMTEGVGKNDVAALFRQIHGGVIAGLILFNRVFVDQIRGRIDAQRLAGGLDPLHMCVGVALVFIADQNCANLEIAVAGGVAAGSRGRGGAGTAGTAGVAAGGQAQDHDD